MTASGSNFNRGDASQNPDRTNAPIPIHKLVSLFILSFLLSINYSYSKNEKPNVCFYVFASSTCDYCKNFIELYIDPLKNQYGAEYKLLDLNKEYFFKIFLEKTLKSEIQGNPKVVVWIENQLIPESDIPEKLPQKLSYFSLKGLPYPELYPNQPQNKHSINEKLQTTTYATVLIAGLTDGINPCAFSTLIFFLSYLLFFHSSQKTILAAGLIFIAASFVTYFLLGIGLLKIIQSFSGFKTLTKVLYTLTGILMLFLSFLNFSDYYLLKKGKNKNLALQLSEKQKSFIHGFIRDKSKWRFPLIGSALIAVIVSLTEFTCTGQIYLPTLMYAIKENTHFMNALILLTAYNLAFILPLTAIFYAVFFGIKSQTLSSGFLKHLPEIKLITGIFFILFGLILLK